MLKLKRGNLLDEKTEALVNTVNCVGVMGKGVALQFKRAFPDNFKQYQKACKNNEVEPGRMFIVATDSLLNPRYIINFPTKRHWRQPSQLDDIKAGLAALVAEVQRLGIRSIAIPPLGCGNGGLDWAEVKPLILEAFKPLPKVEVIVFEPAGAPPVEAMAITTSKPPMTAFRASLIRILELYGLPGYSASRIEIQKLAYFLKVAGEPTLQTLTYQRFHLIEGFETPYGMEMLATLHWVAQEDPQAAADCEVAIERVREWSDRKKNLFKPQHLVMAWNHLKTQDWLG